VPAHCVGSLQRVDNSIRRNHMSTHARSKRVSSRLRRGFETLRVLGFGVRRGRLFDDRRHPPLGQPVRCERDTACARVVEIAGGGQTQPRKSLHDDAAVQETISSACVYGTIKHQAEHRQRWNVEATQSAPTQEKLLLGPPRKGIDGLVDRGTGCSTTARH
jgi:hypothetical protein